MSATFSSTVLYSRRTAREREAAVADERVGAAGQRREVRAEPRGADGGLKETCRLKDPSSESSDALNLPLI